MITSEEMTHPYKTTAILQATGHDPRIFNLDIDTDTRIYGKKREIENDGKRSYFIELIVFDGNGSDGEAESVSAVEAWIGANMPLLMDTGADVMVEFQTTITPGHGSTALGLRPRMIRLLSALNARFVHQCLQVKTK